jgi:hypothetical protein
MPFKKGDKKITGRGKGAKNKKTILKEAIGLSGWDRLAEFVLTEGSDKMIRELKTLKGGSYGFAYREMVEFFKPKLARTEVTGEGGKPIEVNITMDLGK